jgi:hypothetical protein
LLIGDDGQHDPKIYAEFAAARPTHVKAIAIRQLTAGEQVLSHGLPVANDELVPAPTEDLPMPVVRGADGYELARSLRPILGLGQPPITVHAIDDFDDPDEELDLLEDFGSEDDDSWDRDA